MKWQKKTFRWVKDPFIKQAKDPDLMTPEWGFNKVDVLHMKVPKVS